MPSNRPHPELSVLFIDMDAFFASVEQMDRPELRGRPIVITPTPGPSGCCITSSYEARAFGIKTGLRVGEALKLCREVEVVRARPARYIAVHHEILAAIETALPVSKVESVDECWGELLANECDRPRATQIAHKIKAALRDRIGPITCSVGIAPNRMIAKVAAGLQKPDGLTVIGRSELPGALLDMALTDLPGINRGINRRLRSKGIRTMEDLYARSEHQLREAWGSVVGIYWYHWIRGDTLSGPKTRTRTVGHQHVLAPQYRQHDRAWGVAVRLLSKAAQRMRSLKLVARRLTLAVQYVGRDVFADWSPLNGTDDTIELYNAMRDLWEQAPRADVLSIAVRLEDLCPRETQLPLFEGERHRRELMVAMDRINARGGADTVYLARMHGQRGTAPRRIPFGKPPELGLADVDE